MLGPQCSLLAPDFIRFGRNVSLGARVVVESNLIVGDDTLISSQVAFVSNDHDFSDPAFTVFSGRRLEPSVAVVDGDNLIGFRSLVVGSLRIGRGAIIGAGSVVTKDVPEYSVCAGVPARVLRKRFQHEGLDASRHIVKD